MPAGPAMMLAISGAISAAPIFGQALQEMP